MASSELPKTGGSEGSVWTAETEEFNRDKAIEVLEEVGTFKILAEAAAAFGKEDIWGYDYESMSDDELSAFFDKVNEIPILGTPVEVLSMKTTRGLAIRSLKRKSVAKYWRLQAF